MSKMWFITINKSFEVSLAYSEALMHFSESVLSQTQLLRWFWFNLIFFMKNFN